MMAAPVPYSEWVARVDADSEDVSKDKDELYRFTQSGYEWFNGEKSADLTWRLGRAAFKVAAAAEVAGDMDRHKKSLHEAETHVRRAVELDESCSDAHVWLATVLGKTCDFLGSKERIATGKEVQRHLDRALEIRDNDFIAFYTYGRWCYEVAGLTWVERKVAAVMFGTPPEATYKDAMDKFLQVETLKPGWKANLCWIAKTAVQQKDYKTAIQFADKAFDIVSVDEEDVVCEPEIAAIRKKYASYRQK